MNDDKILPICHPAPLKCYLPFSIISSIAAANLGNNNWIYTNFIQIYKHHGTEKIECYPMQDFVYYDQNYFRVNELNNYNYKFERERFIEDIIFWIDASNYVVVYADENKIPGTRMYLQKPMLHSQFIFGYNLEKKIFKLMNFSKEKNDLELLDIPFECIVNGFFDDSTLDLYQSDNLPWIAKGKHYRVELIRFIEEKGIYFDYGIDLQYIVFEIENYLLSKNSSVYSHNFSGRLKGMWGMAIYSQIQETISNNQKSLDIRVFQLMYEHKFYMLERLHLFGKSTEDICRQYEEAVKISVLLKNLCLKYMITTDKTLLSKMRQYIEKLSAIEGECLSKFVKSHKKYFNSDI